MPQCLRAHIPFPFADAGSSCEALSMLRTFGLQTLDGRVSAEGIRSNQRANAKRRLFDAEQMRQALHAALRAETAEVQAWPP